MLRAARQGAVALFLAGVLAFLANGCAQQGASPDAGEGKTPLSSEQIKELGKTERSKGNDAQATLLEDGQVTLQEYRQAFDRLSSCLKGSGFTVTEPTLSPVTGNSFEYAADFGARDAASALPDLDRCEDEHWLSASRAYTLSTPAVMEESLRREVSSCLVADGHDIHGNEQNIADFVDSLADESEPVFACVRERAAVLYPELPSLSIGY